MKITAEWLKEKKACQNGYEWFCNQKESDHQKIVQKLMEGEKYMWANWLVTKLMAKTQLVKYAVFSAEQVLDIYEIKYPNDTRPRNAIQAAKNYLVAARDAAGEASWDDARDAARVADAAAAAAAAGEASWDDAWDAAGDAVRVAGDAGEKGMYTRIIDYGLDLLREYYQTKNDPGREKHERKRSLRQHQKTSTRKKTRS